MSLDAAQDLQAVYLDGRSNRKRGVTLRFGEKLAIVEQGVTLETWPYDAVRRADGPPGLLRLSSTAALPLARIETADPAAIRLIATHCTALDVGRGSRGQTLRIVFWSLAATASILLLAAFGIPFAADRLAPMVPAAVEKRIGEAVDRQAQALFGGEVCSAAEGQAAFAKMVEALRRAGELDDELDAQVLASKIPNAFALPGGKIYLLDGLLQKAQSPDEVAGVIAHELGHVRHRDNMRKIIQTGGTSFLIGLLFGDVTGGSAMIFVGRSLFDASYSRDAERDADAFAAEVMHKLGRSPKPMGEFLLRVTGTQANKSISVLASHPLTEDRLAAMSKEDVAPSGPEILSADEWKALKGICKTKTAAASQKGEEGLSWKIEW